MDELPRKVQAVDFAPPGKEGSLPTRSQPSGNMHFVCQNELNELRTAQGIGKSARARGSIHGGERLRA